MAATATPGEAAHRSAEELRQITVAFCDIVSSTELSTRLDAEEFADLILSYQERVGAILDRYGGAVNRYLGDGILTHFGWPVAHGDDAERAVLAALAIADEFSRADADPPIEVRIGVHTGPVLVGEMGAEGHREQMALGETMNLAAKLQASAPRGAVVITQSTLNLIVGVFVVDDLGPQQLVGIPEPVHAYRVLQRSGVRSRLDAAGARLTPVVNRTAELEWLQRHWDDVAGGAGRALLISGEPGVGKSRLVYELRERLRETNHSWLETHGTSYTEHTAFQPAIALVEQALDLDPAADDPDRLATLRSGLERAGVTDPDAVTIIAGLLSIQSEDLARPVMGPSLAHRRTIEVLADWVLALARLQPLLLLVEDLHWCDASTLDLFEQLLLRGEHEPLLLVGTTRPELEASWDNHPNLHRLDVAPLPESEIRDLVSKLGTGRSMPEPAIRRVVAGADGIPLFAEEIGRMVLESGFMGEGGDEPGADRAIEELEIPATLQDSLMARLDRLSAAKRVAQLASVIGRRFDYRLLAATSGLDPELLAHGLERLVEAELIYPDGEPPDAAYTFKHALIQDAAYRSLPRRSRTPLHERIAAALDERGSTSPEVLARHWEAAGRTGEAVASYALAAEEAARHSAHREAIAHLRKSVRLIPKLPATAETKKSEADLQTALGSSIMASRGYADPEIETAYDRARALCAELGLTGRVGYTMVGLAIYYFNGGQVEEGARLAGEALEVAERDGDENLALLANVQLAVPRLWQGRFAEALTHAESAYSIYDPGRHADLAFRYGTDQGVAALCMAACALASGGRPDTGLARVQDAVALARELANPFNTVYALAFECGIRWMRGELEAQESLAREVVAISEEHGFTDFQGMGRILRGAAHGVLSGDPDGLADCRAGLELASGTGRRGGVTMFLELIASAYASQGQVEDALGWVEGALALAEETGQHFWDARLLRLRGELRLEAGDRHIAGDAAAADFRQGAKVAREQGDALSELECSISLAQLLQQSGDEAAPRRVVEPALDALAEGRDTRAATQAVALLSGSAPASTRT